MVQILSNYLCALQVPIFELELHVDLLKLAFFSKVQDVADFVCDFIEFFMSFRLKCYL